MRTKLESFKDELIQPISEAEPWGEDPKYEDEFAWLKEEVAKMSGMGAGATDWEMVEVQSRKLLGKTAKDLNLLAYMILAWTILYKLPGLVTGMELLQHFLGEPWPEIFPKPIPKRRKARAMTLAWLQTQLGDKLSACESKDAALLEKGLEAAKQTKASIYEHFEDPPANFKHVCKTLQEWFDQAKATEAKTETEPKPEDQSSTDEPKDQLAPQVSAEPAPAPSANKTVKLAPPAVSDDADLSALYELLGKVATQIRSQDPNQPVAYLLQRISLWQGVKAPTHDDSRTSNFPAPPDEQVNSLATMSSNAVWPSLLARAESQMLEYWYWLDLQCYAAQAARAMAADEIAEIIESRTRLLDQSLPELKELKFNDGTAYASPTTRDWLVQIEKAANGETAGEPDPGDELLSAMRQLGSNQFAEAMGEAQEAIKAAPDARTAFRQRVAAARFCLEAEQFYWAESLAEGLAEQIEHHGLSQWEPLLAGKAWSLLLEVAHELKESDESYAALERRAMKQLAALDLGRAGQFPKKRPVY